jgi:hypothetical protein
MNRIGYQEISLEKALSNALKGYEAQVRARLNATTLELMFRQLTLKLSAKHRLWLLLLSRESAHVPKSQSGRRVSHQQPDLFFQTNLRHVSPAGTAFWRTVNAHTPPPASRG